MCVNILISVGTHELYIHFVLYSIFIQAVFIQQNAFLDHVPAYPFHLSKDRKLHAIIDLFRTEKIYLRNTYDKYKFYIIKNFKL